MIPKLIPIALILTSTVTAGYFDVRWRRIPNWLVVLTVLTFFSWHGYMNGTEVLWRSLSGFFLGMAALFPLFLVRGMGAGDVKYFGAIGAAVTYEHLLTVLVLTFVISGLMAVYSIYRWGRIRTVLKNIAAVIGQFRPGTERPNPTVGIDSKEAQLIPFTLAASIATWIVVLTPAVAP